MLTISDSIVSKVVLREFAEEEFDRVVALLSMYGPKRHHVEQNRVRLAALKLAKGDIVNLERQIKVACIDFRDVLAAAEMPGEYTLGFSGMKQMSPEELEQVRADDRKQFEDWIDINGLDNVRDSFRK